MCNNIIIIIITKYNTHIRDNIIIIICLYITLLLLDTSCLLLFLTLI